MNDFRQMIRVNSRKNIDEVICNKITLEMKKLCESIKGTKDIEDDDEENKELKEQQIQQIEDRIRGISKIFINYQRNMENIKENELRNKLLKISKPHKVNETDKELQKIVQKAGKEVYKKIHKEEEKSQVMDRTEGIKELLENFDDDMSFIHKLEMQQTKMGEMIFEEEKTS